MDINLRVWLWTRWWIRWMNQALTRTQPGTLKKFQFTDHTHTRAARYHTGNYELRNWTHCGSLLILASLTNRAVLLRADEFFSISDFRPCKERVEGTERRNRIASVICAKKKLKWKLDDKENRFVNNHAKKVGHSVHFSNDWRHTGVVLCFNSLTSLTSLTPLTANFIEFTADVALDAHMSYK